MTAEAAVPADYKPGLEGVIAGVSAISEVDAERNALIYRGYDIHDLVQECTFDEVAHLLLFGALPDRGELVSFQAKTAALRDVPGYVYDLLRQFPADAHPMDTLKAAVAALAPNDPLNADNSPDACREKSARLYAQIPTLVVNAYRITQGQRLAEPDASLTHSANFFQMLLPGQADPQHVRVFDIIQTLYAEHGYNASTFAARVTVSTLSDLYSGVVSAIGTLKGPLHGGANEAAAAMLAEISGPETAAQWVRDALASKRKIMGFGHREYKKGDERAKIVKKYASELAQQSGNTQWRDVSQVVETEMLQAKNLYPNLDFPVAHAYHLMGLPVPIYTPIFVMSRITGWCAHITEQLENNRLIRPGSLYNGPKARRVVPLADRA